jgi:hypothetical protein
MRQTGTFACDVLLCATGLDRLGEEIRLLVDEHRVMVQVEVTANSVACNLIIGKLQKNYASNSIANYSISSLIKWQGYIRP